MKMRVQFTLRGLLWGTFWVALCISTTMYYFERRGPELPLSGFLAYLLAWISAFAAVGTLFGRTGLGVTAGLLSGTLVYGIFLQ
jgi:hypothetical protein